MDYALTTWLAVNGPFSAPGPAGLGSRNPLRSGSEHLPHSLLLMSTQPYGRPALATTEFEQGLREVIGPHAIADYELLIQRSKLIEYLDGPLPAAMPDNTEYRQLSEYTPERREELQACRDELQAALKATHGPIVSVSAHTVFQYTVSTFIDLSRYESRDYLFSMLAAARQLVQGIGELPFSPVAVREDFTSLFIAAYKKSLMAGHPALWAERVCHSLRAATNSLDPVAGSRYACTDDDISAFIFGFSGPMSGPQIGSLFRSQVAQGLGMAVAMMPERIASKLRS